MKPSIWKSRKFWIMVADFVVSGVLYFGAKYIAPAAFEDVQWLILSLQAPVAFLIGAIAYEDAAFMKSQ